MAVELSIAQISILAKCYDLSSTRGIVSSARYSDHTTRNGRGIRYREKVLVETAVDSIREEFLRYIRH